MHGRSASKESSSRTGRAPSKDSAGTSGAPFGNGARRPSHSGASSVSPRINHASSRPEPSRPSSIGPDPARERRPSINQNGSISVQHNTGKTVCLGSKRRRWLVKVQAVSAMTKASEDARKKAEAANGGRVGSKENPFGARSGSKDAAISSVTCTADAQASWRKMMQAAGCRAEEYEQTPKAGGGGGRRFPGVAVESDEEPVRAFGDLDLGGGDSAKPSPRIIGNQQAPSQRKVAL